MMYYIFIKIYEDKGNSNLLKFWRRSSIFQEKLDEDKYEQ